MPNSGDEAIGGSCCLAVFITSIVLFSCSFAVIEPRWYGLIYDDTFKTVVRNDIKRVLLFLYRCV